MIYNADEFYPTPETLIADTHTVANRKYFLFKPEKAIMQLEYSATPA